MTTLTSAIVKQTTLSWSWLADLGQQVAHIPGNTSDMPGLVNGQAAP
ncbi:MAG: hypothetical protein OXS35_02435 [Dehalococcoidia bacterium]|nr:hypothetical protein [Dehalococcoidia bacterium]